jgi:hypothetical protein
MDWLVTSIISTIVVSGDPLILAEVFACVVELQSAANMSYTKSIPLKRDTNSQRVKILSDEEMSL